MDIWTSLMTLHQCTSGCTHSKYFILIVRAQFPFNYHPPKPSVTTDISNTSHPRPAQLMNINVDINQREKDKGQEGNVLVTLVIITRASLTMLCYVLF